MIYKISMDSTGLNQKQLGSRIRQARENLGLSQEELAEMVSRNQAAISAYENGNRKIAAVDLPLFARVLEVSLLYFYEGDEWNKYDMHRALFEEFDRLPSPQIKQVVIGIIRSIAEIVTMNTQSG